VPLGLEEVQKRLPYLSRSHSGAEYCLLRKVQSSFAGEL
jgi:hypothetical protein